MEFKEKITKNIINISRKAFNVIFIIVCTVLSILATSAVHYKILMETQPGYLYNVYLVNFLWMDILIGLVIGFVLFGIISFVIAYYFKFKEKEPQKA